MPLQAIESRGKAATRGKSNTTEGKAAWATHKAVQLLQQCIIQFLSLHVRSEATGEESSREPQSTVDEHRQAYDQRANGHALWPKHGKPQETARPVK